MKTAKLVGLSSPKAPIGKYKTPVTNHFSNSLNVEKSRNQEKLNSTTTINANISLAYNLHILAEGKIKSPHPKPQNRTASSPVKYTDEIPRGLISIQDCIDLLHNHHLNKEEWTAEKLAERFRLRATDVENLIENFKLLKSEDKL